jgi:cellulose synthase/poly-beta-1,6-N-acetylglucosamine synthase-like glycosyltransferase
MSAALLLFWGSVALLFYIYAGYPIFVAARARLFPRPVRRGVFRGRYTVLISCHNEAVHISAKLKSLLAQTAVDRMDEILVGVDGATDETAALARAVGDPRIIVHVFPERRGKPAVLNDLIPHVRSEAVVMTDARQRVDPSAIERLLECLHDPEVGVVSGELEFEAPAAATTTARGMGVYWRYEKFIRNCEGQSASVPGATGALYAIRRELLRPIPPKTLLDDVAYPMQAVMAGSRCVFEAGARVYDKPSADSAQESTRKRRTIAGVFQLMRLYPEWLNPRRNPIWLNYFSHKVLRLASPWLLMIAFAANIKLARGYSYDALLAGQITFYIIALAGHFLAPRGWCGHLLSAPAFFVALNLTIISASWDAIQGRYKVAWKRAVETV